jgi:hypothetical protein
MTHVRRAIWSLERLNLLWIGLALIVWLAPIGIIEGRAAPVVTPVQLDVIQADGVSSRIRGRFTLLRPGCDFRELEWELVGETRTVPVPVVFEEGAVIRPGGVNEFGWWRLLASPDQITKKGRAVVYHQCPGRPWLTVTHFYPPQEAEE